MSPKKPQNQKTTQQKHPQPKHQKAKPKTKAKNMEKVLKIVTG